MRNWLRMPNQDSRENSLCVSCAGSKFVPWQMTLLTGDVVERTAFFQECVRDNGGLPLDMKAVQMRVKE
jgi:hypothetical protein